MRTPQTVVFPPTERITLTIDQLLQSVASHRNLRQSTVHAYQGFFKRLGIVDDSLTKDELESRLLSIDNINSRRSAAMAVRAVLEIKVHVPSVRPKRYDLPDEDSLRLALMLSKYEVRGFSHQLRHWHATNSLERGVSIAMVSKQLRHPNVAITMNTYAQSRDADIHKAWG
jgi:site-specific recombinase XerD